MLPGADGTGTETAPTSTARNLGQQEKQLFGHQPGGVLLISYLSWNRAV
jgi:hypothetical protein